MEEDLPLRSRMPRKYARVWLDTQVESLASGAVSLGRTENVSVGGLLVFSRDTFETKTQVVVQFVLPSGHGVVAHGLVVHTKPGIRMGIRFTHLTEADEKAIADYIEEVKPYSRRGPRLAKHFTVVLRWRDLEGTEHEELAETIVLTRHGGLLLSPTSIKPGETVFLWWPEKQRGARVRIIFRQLGGIENLAELGFEFVDAGNFWGIDFAADTTWWKPSES